MACVQSPRLLTLGDYQPSWQGHRNLGPIRSEGRATVTVRSTFSVPLLPHTCHMEYLIFRATAKEYDSPRSPAFYG